MKTTDILALKNRKIIYNYISDYPGVHLSELFRRLDLKKSTIRYHIDYLKRKNLIIRKKTKGYTHFFISGSTNPNHEKLLSSFRNSTQRNILLYLLVCTTGSQKGISIALIKTPPTIKHHIDLLEKKKIIEKTPIIDGKIKLTFKKTWIKNYNLHGCKNVYKLTDPYAVYDLFLINKKRLYDNGLTEKLLEFYKVYIWELSKKRSKSFDDEQTVSDRVANMITEIFPMPFCC